MVKAVVSAIKTVKSKPIKPILKNKVEATQILKDSQSIIDDINLQYEGNIFLDFKFLSIAK